MILQPPQINELCKFAIFADREARSDLVGGYIRNEDDYTSNFTGALRRIINSNSQTGLKATSYMLSTSKERQMGCDATIILSSISHSKIIVFESKLPGLGSGKPSWDYPQTSNGLSHFSDQLNRQKKFNSQFAIFEMFYCDYPFKKQPKYMHDYLSSCIWHDEAVKFDNNRSSKSPWTKKELIKMLKNGNTGIDNILQTVCDCNEGKKLNISGSGDNIAGEFQLQGQILQIRSSE